MTPAEINIRLHTITAIVDCAHFLEEFSHDMKNAQIVFSNKAIKINKKEITEKLLKFDKNDSLNVKNLEKLLTNFSLTEIISIFEDIHSKAIIKANEPIIVKDKNQLKSIIEQTVNLLGNNCSLNHIDVSLVANMSHLFYESKFNGDISKWNTSNVTNMNYMFFQSKFNSDISKWDTSNVENMALMFAISIFNQDIGSWNTSSVTDMTSMFYQSKFNKSIASWPINSRVKCLDMFRDCKAPIPPWYSEDPEQIYKNVKAHNLAQSLEKGLSSPTSTTQKIKI